MSHSPVEQPAERVSRPARDEVTQARPPESPFEDGEYYDVLGNARRRACIRYLLRTSGAVSVADVGDHVVDAEGGGTEDPRRKSVYVSLRQTHLPRLASLGVVEFDPETNVVEPAANLEYFAESSAASAAPLDGSWPRAYVAVGMLALAWFAGSLLGVVDLSSDRTMLIALGYVVLLFLVGLWEVQQLRSSLRQFVGGPGR